MSNHLVARADPVQQMTSANGGKNSEELSKLSGFRDTNLTFDSWKHISIRWNNFILKFICLFFWKWGQPFLDKIQTIVHKSFGKCGQIIFCIRVWSHLSEIRFPFSPPASSSWQELLLPLVVTFRDCVREAVGKVQTAVIFVRLQRLLPLTKPHGFTELVQRRHAVFSQAVRLNYVNHS